MIAWLENLPLHTFDIRKAHLQDALTTRNGDEDETEDGKPEDEAEDDATTKEETSNLSDKMTANEPQTKQQDGGTKS